MTHRPTPVVTSETAPYWAAGCRGELLIGTCSACSRTHHPPQAVCPHCWASNTTTKAATGEGTVEAFSVVHRSGVDFFRDRLPYIVATVLLEEGVCLTTNVVDCDVEGVRIGMPVRVTFDRLSEDMAIPVFKPQVRA